MSVDLNIHQKIGLGWELADSGVRFSKSAVQFIPLIFLGGEMVEVGAAGENFLSLVQ